MDDGEIRIMGPKEALTRGLEASDQMGKELVPSFFKEWRPLGDSNPRYRLERAVIGTFGNIEKRPSVQKDKSFKRFLCPIVSRCSVPYFS